MDSHKKNFTWKSFAIFFRIFKLESDFFPQFYAKSEKSKIAKFNFLCPTRVPSFKGTKKMTS